MDSKSSASSRERDSSSYKKTKTISIKDQAYQNI